MEQGTKNILALLLNVIILPGLGTIVHGEGKRGLIQIVCAIISISLVVIGIVGIVFVIPIIFIIIGFLTGFLTWLWALLDGIAFVKNREFYIFKNLK